MMNGTGAAGGISTRPSLQAGRADPTQTIEPGRTALDLATAHGHDGRAERLAQEAKPAAVS